MIGKLSRRRLQGLVPIVAGVVLVVLSYVGLRHDSLSHQQQAWESTLRSEAYARAAVLNVWLNRLRSAGEMLASYPSVQYALDPHTRSPQMEPLQAQPLRHIENLLREVVRLRSYEAAWVLDTLGRVRLRTDSIGRLPEDAMKLAARAADGALDAMDVFLTTDGPKLYYATRVHPERDTTHSLGVLILEVDPRSTIYPMVSAQGLNASSGEVVLVRRSPAGFTIVSPTRQARDYFHYVMDTTRVSYRGTTNTGTLVRGVDGTGEVCLAVAVDVPLTPWELRAKVDEAEAMAEARHVMRLQLLLLIALALATVLAIYAIYRTRWAQRHESLVRQRNRFALALEQANDPIFFLNRDGTVADVNLRACEFYGIPREKFVGMYAGELRPEELRSRFVEQIGQAIDAGSVVYTTEHVRPDGTIAPVEVSARTMQDGNEQRMVAIVHDLTQRRAREHRIALLNRMLRTLSGINSMITRETDPQVILDRACRIAVEEGSFVGAVCVRLDAEGRSVVAGACGVRPDIAGIVDPDPRRLEHQTLLASGQPFVVEITPDSPFAGHTVETARSLAVAPVFVGQRFYGAFAVFADQAAFFSDEVLAMLREIADDVGFALNIIEERQRSEEDRNAAQRVIVESEKRFRWLADHSPDAIVSYQVLPTPRYLYVNKARAELSGYTTDEYYADPMLGSRMTHPDDRGVREQLVYEPTPQQAIVRWIRKDGGMLWVEQRTSPVVDAEGRVTQVLVVARDVTQAHVAEQQLREAHHRLELALGVARQGVYDADLEEHTIMLPAATAVLLGIGQDSMVIPVGQWSEWVHPEDRYILHGQWNALRHGDESGHESTYRFHGSGVMRWLRGVGRIVEHDAAGHANRAVGILTDITEAMRAEQQLRDSQEAYRAIVENSPDVVSRFGPDLRHQYVSPSALRYAPIPADAYVGRTYAELGFPERLCKFWEAHIRGVFADGQIRETEYAAPNEDGPMFFSWRLFPELDARGEVRRVVTVSQDISGKKKLETQYFHAQKLEALGRLAGGVAHDFNNLLTAITGYGTFAAKQLGKEHPAYEDVEEVLAAAGRASSLTRQLLAFSRNQLLQPRPVSVAEVIEPMEKMIRRLIGATISLEVLMPEEELVVMADPSQLEQVVMNLAVNARDAMPNGGALSICLRKLTLAANGLPAGDYAALSVRDDGTGIAPDVLPHIFEPFFTTKAKGHGTGLGLATVYGIAQQSGGELRVESELGKGTVFTVLLPLTAAPALHEMDDAGEPDSYHRPLTVLVAEDEEELRTLVVRTLALRGHNVLAAPDGQEALQRARTYEGKIDILLSDVVMPRMGGRELAEHVVEEWPGTPVLFMTGYTSDAALLEAAAADPDMHVLPKPFAPDKLVRTLEVLAG